MQPPPPLLAIIRINNLQANILKLSLQGAIIMYNIFHWHYFDANPDVKLHADRL